MRESSRADGRTPRWYGQALGMRGHSRGDFGTQLLVERLLTEFEI
jgi:hypothetical protein